MARSQNAKLIYKNLLQLLYILKKNLNEIKKAIPFKIVSKNQVFVSKVNKINASLIHGKHHKTSLREIKGDLNSEIYHVHGSKDSIIVKISIFPRFIYRLCSSYLNSP